MFPPSPHTFFSNNDHIRVVKSLEGAESVTYFPDQGYTGVVSSQLSTELVEHMSELGSKCSLWYEIEHLGKFPSCCMKHEQVALDDEEAFIYFLRAVFHQIEQQELLEQQANIPAMHEKRQFLEYSSIVKYLRQHEKLEVELGELEAHIRDEIAELGSSELDLARQFGEAGSNGHKRFTRLLTERSFNVICERTLALVSGAKEDSHSDDDKSDKSVEFDGKEVTRVRFSPSPATRAIQISRSASLSGESRIDISDSKYPSLHIMRLYRMLCSGRFSRDSLSYSKRSALDPMLAQRIAIKVFIFGKNIINETEIEKYQTFLSSIIEAEIDKVSENGADANKTTSSDVDTDVSSFIDVTEFSYWLSPPKSEEFVLGRVREVLHKKFDGDIDAMFAALGGTSQLPVKCEVFAQNMSMLGEVSASWWVNM
jgi:hypothetical protein